MMATSELQNAANTPSLFTFRGVETDDRSGDVRFRYAYENGFEFCETIQFHAPLPLPDSSLRAGFDAVVEALNVALGVSYYKAFLPSRMAFARAAFAAPQLEFFQKLYVNGLGEFGYRNRVNVSEKVDFRNARFDSQTAPQNGASAASRPAPAPVQLPRRSAVLLGGGKDSLVSVEILRVAQEPMVLLAVNPKKPIADCARASGFPLISVTRNLDPLLFKLNEKGALNGHVPITAIVSLIALAGAFVHGYDTVILSNERSADEGNIIDAGVQINHQYSKASEFEDDLRNYLAKYVGPGLAYFSLLRPLSELHIAQLMAKVDRYDECFTSCNRAFRLHQGAAGQTMVPGLPQVQVCFSHPGNGAGSPSPAAHLRGRSPRRATATSRLRRAGRTYGPQALGVRWRNRREPRGVPASRRRSRLAGHCHCLLVGAAVASGNPRRPTSLGRSAHT